MATKRSSNGDEIGRLEAERTATAAELRKEQHEIERVRMFGGLSGDSKQQIEAEVAPHRERIVELNTRWDNLTRAIDAEKQRLQGRALKPLYLEEEKVWRGRVLPAFVELEKALAELAPIQNAIRVEGGQPRAMSGELYNVTRQVGGIIDHDTRNAGSAYPDGLYAAIDPRLIAD